MNFDAALEYLRTIVGSFAHSFVFCCCPAKAYPKIDGLPFPVQNARTHAHISAYRLLQGETLFRARKLWEVDEVKGWDIAR